MDNLTIKRRDVDDAIDLVDLIKIFWQKKVVILLFLLIGISTSLVYLHFTRPIYQARATIIAPENINLPELNLMAIRDQKKEIFTKYMPSTLFGIYSSFLFSERSKQNFYTKFIEPNRDKLGANYGDIQIKKEQGDKLTLMYRASSPAQAKEFLEQYLMLSQQEALAILDKELNFQKEVKLLSIDKEIELTNKNAAQEIKDELAILEEAYQIAKHAGIEKVIPQNVDSTNFEPFMLGTQVLKTRIELLTKKKYTNLTLPLIRGLQAEKDFYLGLKPSVNRLNLYSLEGGIIAPMAPIFPKNKLILFLGILIGLMIGCIIAILMEFVLRGFFYKKNSNLRIKNDRSETFQQLPISN